MNQAATRPAPLRSSYSMADVSHVTAISRTIAHDEHESEISWKKGLTLLVIGI